MQKKLCDLVIPSWFMKEHKGRYGSYESFYIASECLNRILEITPREKYNLIIIDNGSDLTDEDVKNESHIRFKPSWYWEQADILIRNKENLGYGGGMNQGLACTISDFVLILNNDILFWDGWLEEILDTFNQGLKPEIGLAMPALEKSGRRFPEILNIKKEDVDMKTNSDKFGIHAQFGSCIAIRKEILETLYKNDGFYFDPQFKFLFKEDRDLYQRIYRMGLESYRNHRVRVHHVGGVSVSKHKNKRDISDDNKKKFEEKWKEKL